MSLNDLSFDPEVEGRSSRICLEDESDDLVSRSHSEQAKTASEGIRGVGKGEGFGSTPHVRHNSRCMVRCGERGIDQMLWNGPNSRIFGGEGQIATLYEDFALYSTFT